MFRASIKKPPELTTRGGHPKRVTGTATEQGYIITFLPSLSATPSAHSERDQGPVSGCAEEKLALARYAQKERANGSTPNRLDGDVSHTEHFPAAIAVDRELRDKSSKGCHRKRGEIYLEEGKWLK